MVGYTDTEIHILYSKFLMDVIQCNGILASNYPGTIT